MRRSRCLRTNCSLLSPISGAASASMPCCALRAIPNSAAVRYRRHVTCAHERSSRCASFFPICPCAAHAARRPGARAAAAAAARACASSFVGFPLGLKGAWRGALQLLRGMCKQDRPDSQAVRTAIPRHPLECLHERTARCLRGPRCTYTQRGADLSSTQRCMGLPH